jgi:ABC-type Fe3+/spermidine/putrescine transport system ATPase subunit
MSTHSTVLFNNVTKQFKDFTAVDNISFEVRSGQLITLLGPSGCGKTTTLRMIAGLELATSGQVIIGGEDVSCICRRQKCGDGISVVCIIPPYDSDAKYLFWFK